MTSNHDRHLLLRDHALEALGRGFNDYQSCLLSLEAGDDVGAVHHFGRLVAVIRSAAATLADIREASKAGGAA